MELAMIKMKAEYFLGLMLAVFLSFILVTMPNYQKYAYRETRETIYLPLAKNDLVGYPAADNFPVVASMAEIEEGEYEFFTIELDMDDLTPIDLYMYLKKQTYSDRGFMRIINNNDKDYGGAGRFFVAELASGESVVVLLDDTTIDLPKEGRVRLPIGEYESAGEGRFKDTLVEKSGLTDLNGYIDMAGKWREGEESKQLEEKRDMMKFVVFIVSWILSSYLLCRLTDDKKKD